MGAASDSIHIFVSVRGLQRFCSYSPLCAPFSHLEQGAEPVLSAPTESVRPNAAIQATTYVSTAQNWIRLGVTNRSIKSDLCVLPVYRPIRSWMPIYDEICNVAQSPTPLVLCLPCAQLWLATLLLRRVKLKVYTVVNGNFPFSHICPLP